MSVFILRRGPKVYLRNVFVWKQLVTHTPMTQFVLTSSINTKRIATVIPLEHTWLNLTCEIRLPASFKNKMADLLPRTLLNALKWNQYSHKTGHQCVSKHITVLVHQQVCWLSKWIQLFKNSDSFSQNRLRYPKAKRKYIIWEIL